MTKTGPEVLEEIAAEPSLDKFLDRNPHLMPYTEDELLEVIKRERKNRALFIAKENEK